MQVVRAGGRFVFRAKIDFAHRKHLGLDVQIDVPRGLWIPGEAGTEVIIQSRNQIQHRCVLVRMGGSEC